MRVEPFARAAGALFVVALGLASSDPNARLEWAAYRDDVKAAEESIRAGADVKAPNREGATPLSLACTNGSAAMITLLLKAGADANAAVPAARRH